MVPQSRSMVGWSWIGSDCCLGACESEGFFGFLGLGRSDFGGSFSVRVNCDSNPKDFALEVDFVFDDVAFGSGEVVVISEEAGGDCEIYVSSMMRSEGVPIGKI